MRANIRISVIIPSLNEEKTIATTIQSALNGSPFEVVVIDGRSTDKTVKVASAFPGARVVLAEKRGRSHQMNLGAQMCTGDVYLFLHADSVLPDGWSRRLKSTINTGDVIGGCYCVRLSNRGFIYRLIGWMINARTLLFKSFSGDQAIFMSRGVFSTIGGFPDVPLMEDLIIAGKMRKAGKVAIIRKPVTTSARNWEKWGPVRTIFLMWYLKIQFRMGKAPEELAPYYRDGKFPPLL